MNKITKFCGLFNTTVLVIFVISTLLQKVEVVAVGIYTVEHMQEYYQILMFSLKRYSFRAENSKKHLLCQLRPAACTLYLTLLFLFF